MTLLADDAVGVVGVPASGEASALVRAIESKTGDNQVFEERCCKSVNAVEVLLVESHNSCSAGAGVGEHVARRDSESCCCLSWVEWL